MERPNLTRLLCLLSVVLSTVLRAQVLNSGWVDTHPREAIAILEQDSVLTEERALLLAQAYWRSGAYSIDFLREFIGKYEDSEIYGPSFLRIKSASLLSYNTVLLVEGDSTLSELLRRVHQDSLELIAYAHYLKGYIAYLQDRHVNAFEWYNSGLKYAIASNSYYEGVIYGRLAHFFRMYDDYQRARKYALLALNIAEQHEKPASMAISHLELSSIYAHLDSVPQSLLHAQEALDFYRENNLYLEQIIPSLLVLDAAISLKDSALFADALPVASPFQDNFDHYYRSYIPEFLYARYMFDVLRDSSEIYFVRTKTNVALDTQWVAQIFQRETFSEERSLGERKEAADYLVQLAVFLEDIPLLAKALKEDALITKKIAAVEQSAGTDQKRKLAALIAQHDAENMSRQANNLKSLREEQVAILNGARRQALWQVLLLVVVLVPVLWLLHRLRQFNVRAQEENESGELQDWVNGLFPRPSKGLRKLLKRANNKVTYRHVVVSIRLNGAHNIESETHPSQWIGVLDRLFQEWDICIAESSLEKIGASSDTYWLLFAEEFKNNTIQEMQEVFMHFQSTARNVARILQLDNFYLSIVADYRDIYAFDNNAFGVHITGEGLHDLDALHGQVRQAGSLVSKELWDNANQHPELTQARAIRMLDYRSTEVENNRKMWVFIPQSE